MLFRVFDTQLSAQGMEGISEISELLGPSLVIVCSISCIGLHSFQHGNTFPLLHPQKNPKWARPHIFHRLLCGTFLPVSFPPMFNMGERFKECEGDIFPIGKIMNKEIKF
jgi:hypothetical protein